MYQNDIQYWIIECAGNFMWGNPENPKNVRPWIPGEPLGFPPKGDDMNRQTFHDIVRMRTEQRQKMFKMKSADYATDQDMLSNFKRVGDAAQILRVEELPHYLKYPFYMILNKLDRWINLIISARKPENESVNDTIMDLQNYIDLADAVHRDKERQTKEEYEHQ